MTSAQTLIDHDLAQFGWLESIGTNSISNFKSPNANIDIKVSDEENSDLIDKFIYHLIFYTIFCYSFFIFFLIDIGFGSFIKKEVTTIMKIYQKKKIDSFIPTHSNCE